MPLTIDDAEVDTAALGLETVGQALSHVAKDKRLVTQLLIDGRTPDLTSMDAVRGEPIGDRVVYIETATALSLARDALDAMLEETDTAQKLQAEAVDLLTKNDTTAALQKLGGCFTIWQTSRETVQKVGELMQIDLNHLMVRNTRMTDVMAKFGEQLRQLRSALEAGDFVLLMDVVGYEMADTAADWRAIAQMLRQKLGLEGA